VLRWTITKVLSITVNSTDKNNKETDTKIFIVKAIQNKFSRIGIIELISFKMIIIKN
jgi:hypothetical protein